MKQTYEVILADEPLPEISTLERPEELMIRPPYRLLVRQESKMRIEVQGSHQGSLRVLEGYLRRWVRTSVDFVNRVSCLVLYVLLGTNVVYLFLCLVLHLNTCFCLSAVWK